MFKKLWQKLFGSYYEPTIAPRNLDAMIQDDLRQLTERNLWQDEAVMSTDPDLDSAWKIEQDIKLFGEDSDESNN